MSGYRSNNVIVSPAARCAHPGGFRAATGEWQCSRCGARFPSYEAWGAQTGNMAAVEAVKAAIVADIEREGL